MDRPLDGNNTEVHDSTRVAAIWCTGGVRLTTNGLLIGTGLANRRRMFRRQAIPAEAVLCKLERNTAFLASVM